MEQSGVTEGLKRRSDEGKADGLGRRELKEQLEGKT